MVLVVILCLAVVGCGTAASQVSASTTPTSTPTIRTVSAAATDSAGTVVLTLKAPAQNTRATTSFAVSGMSNSVEANTPWSLVSGATHRTVRTGFFTAAGWGAHLYPFSGRVSVAGLPHGTYIFTVRVDDPSDGEGRPVPQLSRVIIVG